MSQSSGSTGPATAVIVGSTVGVIIPILTVVVVTVLCVYSSQKTYCKNKGIIILQNFSTMLLSSVWLVRLIRICITATSSLFSFYNCVIQVNY